MKKVMQTITGLGGNCEGATIATLLGLNIEDVPSFWEGIDIKTTDTDESGVIYQSRKKPTRSGWIDWNQFGSMKR